MDFFQAKIFHRDLTHEQIKLFPREREPVVNRQCCCLVLLAQIYILEPGHHTFWTFSILLSESRSDEQSRGSCRQTELAKILSQTEPSVLLTYLKCMPSANTELVRGRLTMMTRIALT